MQKFIIHIFLTNSNEQETFAKLLQLLPSYGFKNFVISQNTNKKFQLPIGVYFFQERSLNGIYLAPQYPVVIEGLSHAAVLKESINIKRKFLNLNEIDEFDFLKLLKQKAQEYKFDPKDYIRHSFNSGYSGGEKKRNEMLQISLLNPDFIILDEIDSGLDIEMMDFIAQKIKEHQNQNKTILLITHYPDFANLINPDFVHILKNGSILTTGDKYLLEKIHQNGFGDFNV